MSIIYRKVTYDNGTSQLYKYNTLNNKEQCIYDSDDAYHDKHWTIYTPPLTGYGTTEIDITEEEAFLEMI